ncbi:hypothetical protein Mycch_0608 [Mycolicibacterium chubuense NBB4]|uniref:Transmembrane protein n=1 Tax=Mycolicibacterium chubuense (strain NBB4) TaxID=710421 RepID=I4BDR9_MYCCN|nr:hypothetical protein [Mycolicibacterium chubuense]AFM15426.1 hypothetical protein Mycch_0608 [Mycolicibacterium chubuense NBB4]
MTESDDISSTRPISVAELLARNGTIGAPPVGGRRRRRRGNADAVTVAELTGEIPIIRPEDAAPAPEAEEPAAEAEIPEAEIDETPSTNGAVDHATDGDVESEPDSEVDTDAESVDTEAEPVDEETAEEEPAGEDAVDEAEVAESDVEAETETEGDVDEEAEEAELDDEDAAQTEAEEDDDTGVGDDVDDEYADAVADYTAHLEQRDAESAPVDFFTPPRRSGFKRWSRKQAIDVDAEHMSPDPVEVESAVDLVDAPEIEDLDTEAAVAAGLDEDGTRTVDEDELPSYLRSTEEPLFGGQTVADDIATRDTRPSPEDIDLDEDDLDEDDLDEDLEDEEAVEPRRMSSLVHGAWIVAQSVIAVVFGAGLFVAFDQLWKWNNIVALVLSVLVILGLVVGVRVVRKTEDIGSTLIAVAVGALVTLGPLALLQSG